MGPAAISSTGSSDCGSRRSPGRRKYLATASHRILHAVNGRRLLRPRSRFPCLPRDIGGRTMSYSGSGNGGASNSGGAWRNDGGVPPHAFDPDLQPELFRGVPTRRVFAFLIDLVVLTVPVILGYIFIAVFGVITLGLGWMLFW